MDLLVVAGLAANFVALVTIGYLVLRRHRGTGETRVDLDHRIGQLERDIPRLVVETRAEQAEGLSQHMSSLSRLLVTQLEAAQTSMDDGLRHAGGAVADVRERLGELTESTKRLERLGESVGEVERLLSIPRLRGSLGEVWLRQLLERSLPASLFELQYSFPTGDRVDAVIRVGDRIVPVDAKFPLEACRRMLDAAEDERGRARRHFESSLRARVDEIASKYILPEQGTFDFALMYIPAERVYYEAVLQSEQAGRGPAPLDYAMERRVVPVSPTTFHVYLTVIVHGLRGLQVERTAAEILGSLRSLQLEVGRAQRLHDVVGKHLDNAMRQFGEARRHLDRIRAGLDSASRLDQAESASSPAELSS